MNSQPFHQWITRKYGSFTQHRRKYPTLVHLRFPQRKISLAQYLLIKHEHITIFPRLRTRVYSFNHYFYLKFNLFSPQYHLHPAIQILPFLTRVNTRFTPTNARKRPAAAAVGARPDFMFARTIGKIRVESEKDLYHYRDSYHSYHRQVQTGHEHEVVQLFHRFYRLQSTVFPDSLPGPFTGEGYQLAVGSWQLAKREEARKRRNEETEKRRLEVEGFPEHLEPDSLYRLMIMSKNISHVVDPGKEAFFSSLHYPDSSSKKGLILLRDHGLRVYEFTGYGSTGTRDSVSSSQSQNSLLLCLLTRYLATSQLAASSPTPSLQQFLELRYSNLFFFTRNRYDSNATAGTIEKLLPGIVKSPTYFFEPRRHAKRREEEKKRRSEETEKRRREAEGFPGHLEPGSIYRSMIMSKTISLSFDSGKEAFQMARMRLLRPVTLDATLWGPLLQKLSERRHSDLFFFTRNRYDSNAAVVTIEKSLARMVKFPTYFFEPRRHEGSQLAVGSWQLARREETEKRRLEAEGFPERLEPGSLYRLMIMSRNISHVDDPGKEGFYMARMGLLRLVTLCATQWGPERLEPDSLYRLMIMSKNISHLVDPDKEAFQMVRRTYLGSSRYAPRRGVDSGKEVFHRHERNQLAIGSRQLARREEMWKRRNVETKKRSREAKGFHEFLERSSLYKSMIMSKEISFVVVPGKEVFHRHEGNQLAIGSRQMARKRQLAVGSWQLARREETWKRRNEETQKRRIEAEGFLKRLEPGFLYHSIIMSKNISQVVDTGKEVFHMVRTGLFEKFLEVSEPFYKKVLTRRRPEGGQLAVGSWQLARREGEGFPKRLERDSLYRLMIMSRNISHVVDPGKEAFQMVRRTLNGSSRYVPRRGAALDYFTPHQASVRDRDQSLIEAGKPGFPAMDVKDKITSENIFGNHASPGISQQQGPNIDIDQLTDRVYRVLEDKIRMEKEMRGW